MFIICFLDFANDNNENDGDKFVFGGFQINEKKKYIYTQEREREWIFFCSATKRERERESKKSRLNTMTNNEAIMPPITFDLVFLFRALEHHKYLVYLFVCFFFSKTIYRPKRPSFERNIQLNIYHLDFLFLCFFFFMGLNNFVSFIHFFF